MIDNKLSSSTKFEFIKQDLLRRIDNGEFSKTGRVPSENELSEEYSVSTTTSRRTLNELVISGHIKRIRGKGSFLTESYIKKADQEAEKSLLTKGIVPLVLSSYEVSDSPFMAIINGAQQTFSSMGYSMTIECSNLNINNEREIIEHSIQNKVSGLLIFSNDPDLNLEKFKELERANIPYVLIDRMFQNYPCTLVSSYHYDGMFQITKYLLEQGHKKIIFLCEEACTNVTWERLDGYKRAIELYGGVYKEEFCLTKNYSQIHMLPRLIDEMGATAVACLNDRIALKAKNYLENEGRRIPDDVSITGFDDSELGKFAGLTTVRQQWKEIGEKAAKKLYEKMSGNASHSQIRLATDLIVRDSVARIL